MVLIMTKADAVQYLQINSSTNYVNIGSLRNEDKNQNKLKMSSFLIICSRSERLTSWFLILSLKPAQLTHIFLAFLLMFKFNVIFTIASYTNYELTVVDRGLCYDPFERDMLELYIILHQVITEPHTEHWLSL